MIRIAPTLLALALTFSIVGFAEADRREQKAKQPEPKATFAFGAAVGFPLVAAATANYWGGEDDPITLRFSLGAGTQLDIAYRISAGETFQTHLGISGGAIFIGGIYGGTYSYVGPTFALSHRHLWLQIGPDFAFGEGTKAILSTKSRGILMHAQLGYQF